MPRTWIALLVCVLVSEAQGQLIDPNQRCYYPPGSRECVPLPPPQQPQQLPPPPTPVGDFVFYYTTDPVPGTKNMMVTNVWQTQESASQIENELDTFERSQGINVSFRCSIEPSRATQQTKLQQMISSYSLRGYNIAQVTHR